MSSLQRNAHIAGLNNPFANQYPVASSMYRPVGGGAPGILAGVPTGFTIAMGLRVPQALSNDLWAQFGPQSSPPQSFPVAAQIPATEFLCGTFDLLGNNGWILASDGGLVTLGVGDTLEVNCADLAFGMQDLIVLASFVGNDGPYGGLGDPALVGGYNGDAQVDAIAGANVFAPQAEFGLGGSPDPGFGTLAPTGIAAGAFRTQINSFWMTAGIPTFVQANEFFQASMEAGQVIPQAWAPVRTAGDPNPASPDSPTGHHWTASDLALSDGLGGTWTDRIGGVVLERVGFASDSARELAAGPNYFAAG